MTLPKSNTVFYFLSSLRNFAKRTRSNGFRITSILSISYLVARFGYLVWLECQNLDVPKWFLKPITSATFSIADNLFAAWLFALLVYLLRESILDVVNNSNRVRAFEGYDSFAEVLSDMASKQVPERTHITLLTPFFFTEATLENVNDYSQPNTSGSFATVSATIRKLVEDSTDSYERVLVGKTSSDSINTGTAAFIKSLYFKQSSSFPPTTELGYHNNLNESFTFIVHQLESNSTSAKTHAVALISAVFSNEYRHVIGYSTQDQNLIGQAVRFSDYRIKEAVKAGQYFKNHAASSLTTSEKSMLADFETAIMNFYRTPGPGYQVSSNSKN